MNYNKLICQYDEVVMGKVPVAESKLSRKWFKGIWLGKLELVAIFLIEEASEGNWVYVRAPAEWYELFQEWLTTLPPADRSYYQHRFRNVLFRLDGNLYGRRTAGSVYRDELEEIGKFTKRFQFERGVKDPCVFRCKKTHVVLIHHINDVRAAEPDKHLSFLFDEEFLRHCEVQTRELERAGTTVEVLERTKIRLADAILTEDPKHVENIKTLLDISVRTGLKFQASSSIF